MRHLTDAPPGSEVPRACRIVTTGSDEPFRIRAKLHTVDRPCVRQSGPDEFGTGQVPHNGGTVATSERQAASVSAEVRAAHQMQVCSKQMERLGGSQIPSGGSSGESQKDGEPAIGAENACAD